MKKDGIVCSEGRWYVRVMRRGDGVVGSSGVKECARENVVHGALNFDDTLRICVIPSYLRVSPKYTVHYLAIIVVAVVAISWNNFHRVYENMYRKSIVFHFIFFFHQHW